MDGRTLIAESLTMSYEWCREPAEDLADAPMSRASPERGVHAMWVVGHLTSARAGLLSMAEGGPNPAAAWDHLFPGGTQPSDDPAIYPAYDQLLSVWADAHERSLKFVASLSEADLDRRPDAVPAPLSEMDTFQSVGRILSFIAGHEMSHRGQLAEIRRSLGRPILGM